MSGTVISFNPSPTFEHLDAAYMANVIREWENHAILPFLTQALYELLELKRESDEALTECKVTIPISAIRGRLWVIHTRNGAPPTPVLRPFFGREGHKRLSTKIFRILVLSHAVKVLSPKGFRCQRVIREGEREQKLHCLEISWNPPA